MAKYDQACSVEGCNSPILTKKSGLCNKHLLRLKKHGDVSVSLCKRVPKGTPCGVAGCEKPYSHSGYCAAHALKYKKYGDPLGGPENPHHNKNRRWLDEHKDFAGSDCLTWPFGTNSNGRGLVYLNKKPMPASRYMCLLVNGDPPTPEHHAAHTCGNGHLGCVHPKHLRWATPKENEDDKRIHGTLRRGADINTSKLSEVDVLAIRNSSASGVSLAKRYGVTTTTISNVKRRKSWAWL